MKKHLIAVSATIAAVTSFVILRTTPTRDAGSRERQPEKEMAAETQAQPKSVNEAAVMADQSRSVEVIPTVHTDALPTPPDLKKITAFEEWTKRWTNASAADRERIKAEGVALATERRP